MSIFTIYKETKRNREALVRLDLSLSLASLSLSFSSSELRCVCRFGLEVFYYYLFSRSRFSELINGPFHSNAGPILALIRN